jgi:hypothetical protein
MAGGSCRDQIVAAIQALEWRTGAQVFTARDVYPEIAAAGTRYAESTVFKTMQRLREPPTRQPLVRLERSGGGGFRIAEER